MEDTYFTRKAEDIYGPQTIKETEAHFGDEAVTEVFFSVSAQIDMLVEEAEVDVWQAEFRDLADEDWTLAKVLDAADEIAKLAHQQKSRVWPAITSLAAAMRAMVRTARLAPAESFGEVKKDEGIMPPGLVAVTANEDTKPLDLVVAAVAEDLGPGTATATAVASERETCIALVKAQIEKTLGEDQTVESAERELSEAMGRHEELEAALSDSLEKGADDDVRHERQRQADEAEAEVTRLSARLASAELLDQVLKAIEARRPPEPDESPAPPADVTP